MAGVMAGWHGKALSRRVQLTVIVGALSLVGGLITFLPFLLTPSDVIPDVDQDGDVSCDDAIRPGPIPVISSTLFSCPELFDGHTVSIAGEAIGNVLRGPADRHWVQVNDDIYSQVGPLKSHHHTLGTNSGVAVLLPPGRIPQLLGGPGMQGDRLEVIGEFQLSARADQGGPAIIADEVVTTRGGHAMDNPPNRRLQVAALVMVLVTVVLGLAVRRRRGVQR